MSLSFTFNGAPLSPPQSSTRESSPILPPIPTASPISSPSRAMRRQPEASAHDHYGQTDTYGAEDGVDGDYEDYGEDYGEGFEGDAREYSGGSHEYEMEENSFPAKMPGSYYSQVDSFLMAPPPNLKAIVCKGGSGPSAESLKRQTEDLKRAAPPPAPRPKGSKSSGTAKGSKSGKDFDFHLLEQAMAYTQSLDGGRDLDDGYRDSTSEGGGGYHASSGSQRVLADGSPPRQGNPVQALRQGRRREATTTSTAPSAPLDAASRASRSSGGGGKESAQGKMTASLSAYGSLKKKEKPSAARKSKVGSDPRRKSGGASNPDGKSSSAGSVSGGGTGRRRPGSGGGGGGGGNFGAGDFGGREEPGALGGSNEAAEDIESLVNNFEQGLELQRLRAELANSRQRMAASTSALTTAAQQFYAQEPGLAGGASDGKKQNGSSNKR